MLTISHFSKTYSGGKRAVDDLSLTVEAGEMMGFIGMGNNPIVGATVKMAVRVFEAIINK